MLPFGHDRSSSYPCSHSCWGQFSDIFCMCATALWKCRNAEGQDASKSTIVCGAAADLMTVLTARSMTDSAMCRLPPWRLAG